jgi:hypothetical protein
VPGQGEEGRARDVGELGGRLFLFRARDAGTGAARACSGRGGGVAITAAGDNNTTAGLALDDGDGSVMTMSLCMG